MVASAITEFSTCGVAQDTNLGKMNYESSHVNLKFAA
jgi:hypothetical protein